MKTLQTLCLCLLLCSSSAMATELKTLIQEAIQQDPTLDEAKANLAVAEQQVKISQAGHYPTLSLQSTQVLAQKQREHENKRHSEPSLVGKVNLYSWGAIESEVERDKHKQDFYQHKLAETQEYLGQKIGELYLTALRAKETIAVYRESLVRHQKILEDIQIIASYDTGREFEVNEARTRKNQIESVLLQQEKLLHSTLSKLARYTSKPITADKLSDPFRKVQTQKFVAAFHNPDMTKNPTYQAQQKELESAKAAVNAAKAKQLPAINLEGSASRHQREVYVGVSWDIFNPAAKHTEEQRAYSQAAADAKLREIALEVEEKGRTAETDMIRNQKLMSITAKQIGLQRKVVEDHELQFQTATKSLLNVLDAYQELATVQIAEVTARNDFRDAALNYLTSQAKMVDWAQQQKSHSGK